MNKGNHQIAFSARHSVRFSVTVETETFAGKEFVLMLIRARSDVGNRNQKETRARTHTGTAAGKHWAYSACVQRQVVYPIIPNQIQ